MPGAVIRIDQVRPGPVTSTGTPGVARDDLWIGSQINLVSTVGGNADQQWTVLDKPDDSAITLAAADQVTSTFTPDVGGSYRIQLSADSGNFVQVLIVAVTKDSAGATIQRGWRIPAFKEKGSEANFVGNSRGWRSAIRTIFADIRAELDAFDAFITGGTIAHATTADTATTAGSATTATTAGSAPPSGAAAGSLAGTYPNPSVKQLDGSGGKLPIVCAEVVNQSTATSKSHAREDSLNTTDNTAHDLLNIDVSGTPNAGIMLDVVVLAVLHGAGTMHWYKKSRAFLNTAGTITNGAQKDVDDEQVGSAPPGVWTVTIDSLAQALRVRVNSGNDNVSWYVVSQRIRTVPV